MTTDAAHLILEDSLSSRGQPLPGYSYTDLSRAEDEREVYSETHANGRGFNANGKGKERAYGQDRGQDGEQSNLSTGRSGGSGGAASHGHHGRTPSWAGQRANDAEHSGAIDDKRRLRRLWWRSALINCIFIAAWYCFSTLISVYNKWMFSEEHFNFPFPLFVTSIHMLVQWTLAAIVLSLFPRLRPQARPAANDYATKVAPCGMATGLDIGLSNLSLRTITLSFYTMCKSSGLAFVLLFAFLFKLEKPSWRLAGIILIITSGVILMVSTETQFHFVGMVEVLTASALGGLRWSLTQLLLDKESMGMGNPIATLFWLAPIMGITLALCSMMFDGWFTVFGNEAFFGSFAKTLHTFLAILFPGCLAFLMNVTEFGLIQRTSVVTLSVAGIFKEVAVIFLSTIVFHDVLTPINVSGLVVTIFGIALYNYLKYRQFTNAQSPSGKAGRTSQDRVAMGHARSSGEEELPMLPHERSNLPQPVSTRAEQAAFYSLGESPPSSRDSLVVDSTAQSHHLVRMSEDNKRHQHDADRIRGLAERVEEDEDLVKIDDEIESFEREVASKATPAASHSASDRRLL
ncbi:hypothetical protein JCM10212_004986 [Sporobolomyces blumeae]